MDAHPLRPFLKETLRCCSVARKALARLPAPTIEGTWTIKEYLNPIYEYDEATDSGRIVGHVDLARYVDMTLTLNNGKLMWIFNPPVERLAQSPEPTRFFRLVDSHRAQAQGTGAFRLFYAGASVTLQISGPRR